MSNEETGGGMVCGDCGKDLTRLLRYWATTPFGCTGTCTCGRGSGKNSGGCGRRLASWRDGWVWHSGYRDGRGQECLQTRTFLDWRGRKTLGGKTWCGGFLVRRGLHHAAHAGTSSANARYLPGSSFTVSITNGRSIERRNEKAGVCAPARESQPRKGISGGRGKWDDIWDQKVRWSREVLSRDLRDRAVPKISQKRLRINRKMKKAE